MNLQGYEVPSSYLEEAEALLRGPKGTTVKMLGGRSTISPKGIHRWK